MKAPIKIAQREGKKIKTEFNMHCVQQAKSELSLMAKKLL